MLKTVMGGLPRVNKEPSLDVEASSRSLLALKRFVRGPFRQIGVVCLVFGLILNLATPVPHEFASKPASPPAHQRLDYSLLEHSPERSASISAVRPSANTVSLSAGSLLRPHLTHHRLTSSRLSMPRTAERKLASLTD